MRCLGPGIGGSREGAGTSSNFFSFSCIFLGTLAKIIGWRPRLCSWRPSWVVCKVWLALFRVLSTVLCIEFQKFFFFTLKINYSSVSFFSNKIYFKTIYLFHLFYKKNKLHKLVQRPTHVNILQCNDRQKLVQRLG